MTPAEARFNAVMQRLAAVEARLAVLEAGGGARASVASSSTGGGVASDRDLDSEWGDPVVKKDPKRWIDGGGDSYASCRMSQCPSDYLNALANLYDWQADKDEESNASYVNNAGKTVFTAPFKRKDAARARGWAKRNEGKSAAPVAESHDDGSDIPF